jgi:hypothetical protein
MSIKHGDRYMLEKGGVRYTVRIEADRKTYPDGEGVTWYAVPEGGARIPGSGWGNPMHDENDRSMRLGYSDDFALQTIAKVGMVKISSAGKRKKYTRKSKKRATRRRS